MRLAFWKRAAPLPTEETIEQILAGDSPFAPIWLGDVAFAVPALRPKAMRALGHLGRTADLRNQAQINRALECAKVLAEICLGMDMGDLDEKELAQRQKIAIEEIVSMNGKDHDNWNLSSQIKNCVLIARNVTSDEVNILAIDAIARLGTPGPLGDFATPHKNLVVSSHAIKALEKLAQNPDPHSTGVTACFVLSNTVNNYTPLAMQAIGALKNIGTDEATQRLADIVHEGNYVQEALEALASISSDKAVNFVTDFAFDSDGEPAQPVYAAIALEAVIAQRERHFKAMKEADPADFVLPPSAALMQAIVEVSKAKNLEAYHEGASDTESLARIRAALETIDSWQVAARQYQLTHMFDAVGQAVADRQAVLTGLDRWYDADPAP